MGSLTSHLRELLESAAYHSDSNILHLPKLKALAFMALWPLTSNRRCRFRLKTTSGSAGPLAGIPVNILDDGKIQVVGDFKRLPVANQGPESILL